MHVVTGTHRRRHAIRRIAPPAGLAGMTGSHATPGWWGYTSRRNVSPIGQRPYRHVRACPGHPRKHGVSICHRQDQYVVQPGTLGTRPSMTVGWQAERGQWLQCLVLLAYTRSTVPDRGLSRGPHDLQQPFGGPLWGWRASPAPILTSPSHHRRPDPRGAPLRWATGTRSPAAAQTSPASRGGSLADCARCHRDRVRATLHPPATIPPRTARGRSLRAGGRVRGR